VLSRFQIYSDRCQEFQMHRLRACGHDLKRASCHASRPRLTDVASSSLLGNAWQSQSGALKWCALFSPLPDAAQIGRRDRPATKSRTDTTDVYEHINTSILKLCTECVGHFWLNLGPQCGSLVVGHFRGSLSWATITCRWSVAFPRTCARTATEARRRREWYSWRP